MFLLWSSTTRSQPSHLSSSSLVHRDLSPRHRRAIFWLDCQSLSVAWTACVRGAANCQRGGWMMDLVLTLFSLLLDFLIHGGDQLVEGIVKELDGFVQKLASDVLHGDSGLFKIGHSLVSRGEIGVERTADDTVIAEGVHGGRRNRVDGLRADQLFDIENIAILWIFGAGAGPEQALRMCAASGQSAPARAGDHLLIPAIRLLGVGDGDFAVKGAKERSEER